MRDRFSFGGFGGFGDDSKEALTMHDGGKKRIFEFSKKEKKKRREIGAERKRIC